MSAPIIIAAILGDSDLACLDGLRREHFPPERNLIPAHLTLFHHLPPSMEKEVRASLSQETRSVSPPMARISGIMNLGRGTAFRIDSPALEDIRAHLADRFTGLLTPQDQAGWRPHVTIQNKVAPEEARALQHALQAGFTPRPLAICGLAAWYYRGGPWEAISRHAFG